MFFYANGSANHLLGTDFFLSKGMGSAVKRVMFISGRVWYIILRGHWCDVLNVLASTKDKSDDTKNSFYKELECVFNESPKYTVFQINGRIICVSY